MANTSALLARNITQNSSKQSYAITRLLVDRDLEDDCFRAYAYFRWADDVLDVYARTREERIAFIQRQKRLIESCYRGERPDDLSPEEEMVADLIDHDRGENSGLKSFIHGFIGVLDFDAKRKGKLISQSDLAWYSRSLGRAVTDAIQYFIGNDTAYPDDERRYLAATAAHMTHMLRDMTEDLNEGFINIPHEWLAIHNPDSGEEAFALSLAQSPEFRRWVRSQVEMARSTFQAGKRYLEELAVLRCKIAGFWYCARFECVLDAIEHDNFILRGEYRERSRMATKLKMGWIAASLTVRHFIQRTYRRGRRRATVEPYLKRSVSGQ